MSILIKGASLPESCKWCGLSSYLKYYKCPFCDIIKEDYPENRYDGCPLVEVPEPHGRLIDGDDLITAFPANEDGADVKIASVRGTILHAPTVIEAEGENNG